MERVRCAERTCIHHNGGCTAPTIQVRAFSGKALCNTYEASPVEVNTATNHMSGEGNGYIGDGVVSDHPYARERAQPRSFAKSETARDLSSAVVCKIACTVSACAYHANYACTARHIDVGMPGDDAVDTACRTFTPGKK